MKIKDVAIVKVGQRRTFREILAFLVSRKMLKRDAVWSVHVGPEAGEDADSEAECFEACRDAGAERVLFKEVTGGGDGEE